MIGNAQFQVRDGHLFSPFDSLGLRYLVQFGAEKGTGTENLAPDDSNTKVRRICESKKAMTITPVAKGSRQMTKKHQVKDVDGVIQRPRAVLSSPDNDDLIGKMNKKALKRGSTPKADTSGRVSSGRVDVDNSHIRVRGISTTFDKQNRPKMKDYYYTRCSFLKDKPCITKQK